MTALQASFCTFNAVKCQDQKVKPKLKQGSEVRTQSLSIQCALTALCGCV